MCTVNSDSPLLPGSNPIQLTNITSRCTRFPWIRWRRCGDCPDGFHRLLLRRLCSPPRSRLRSSLLELVHDRVHCDTSIRRCWWWRRRRYPVNTTTLPAVFEHHFHECGVCGHSRRTGNLHLVPGSFNPPLIWKIMKKFLVTGSSGFIGRHLVATFADRGYEVGEMNISAPG